MEQEEFGTLENIRQAAITEFLEKGFRGASLRKIVKNAGVTTGAFYGYYSSKDALFSSLVEPHAAAVMGQFMKIQNEFSALPKAEQPGHVGMESGDFTQWMVDYMYQHLEEFKLLACCAGGTSYENFLHNMVEAEVESTEQFMEVQRRLGHGIPMLDRNFCHMIASSMFNGVFEVIAHDMPYEQAKGYVSQLQTFYLAGWQKLMGF